jgi:hypothetical protein
LRAAINTTKPKHVNLARAAVPLELRIQVQRDEALEVKGEQQILDHHRQERGVLAGLEGLL